MKKYISFLGTTEYIECIYTYGGKEATPSRFVQTAIYEHFSEAGDECEFIVFVTDTSRARNWEDSIDREGNPLEGLASAFQRIAPDVHMKVIEISDNHDEQSNWEIFDKLIQEIGDQDEIYFDITHGYRSFPMLALIVLNYVRFIKQARIGKIVYGQFEQLGPAYLVKELKMEERKAPILDFTNMLSLLDWTNGVDAFLRNGDTSLIRELSQSERRELFLNSGNVTTEMKKEAALLDKFAKQLDVVSQSFETCRGQTINKEIRLMKDMIQEIKNEKAEQIKPLVPLVGEVEKKFDGFGDNFTMDTFAIIDWCIDNHLIQQGYTFLQENVITLILRACGLDEIERENREDVNSAIRIVKDSIGRENWRVHDSAKTEKIIRFIKKNVDFIEPYGALTDYRNNINHAGMNKNNITYNKFSKKLEELADTFRPFFEAVANEIDH